MKFIEIEGKVQISLLLAQAFLEYDFRHFSSVESFDSAILAKNWSIKANLELESRLGMTGSRKNLRRIASLRGGSIESEGKYLIFEMRPHVPFYCQRVCFTGIEFAAIFGFLKSSDSDVSMESIQKIWYRKRTIQI